MASCENVTFSPKIMNPTTTSMRTVILFERSVRFISILLQGLSCEWTIDCVSLHARHVHKKSRCLKKGTLSRRFFPATDANVERGPDYSGGAGSISIAAFPFGLLSYFMSSTFL